MKAIYLSGKGGWNHPTERCGTLHNAKMNKIESWFWLNINISYYFLKNRMIPKKITIKAIVLFLYTSAQLLIFASLLLTSTNILIHLFFSSLTIFFYYVAAFQNVHLSLISLVYIKLQFNSNNKKGTLLLQQRSKIDKTPI